MIPNTNCEQTERHNQLDTSDAEKAVTPLGVRLRKIISPILLLAFRTQKKSRIIVDDLAPLRRRKICLPKRMPSGRGWWMHPLR